MSGPHAEDPLAIYVSEDGDHLGQPAARFMYEETIAEHTPATPGGVCPVCDVPDCEVRRLASFRYVLGPGGAVPPVAGSGPAT